MGQVKFIHRVHSPARGSVATRVRETPPRVAPQHRSKHDRVCAVLSRECDLLPHVILTRTGAFQSSLDILWGMDLHWCDLESLVGIPDELGDSPWDSDDDSSDNVSLQVGSSFFCPETSCFRDVRSVHTPASSIWRMQCSKCT